MQNEHLDCGSDGSITRTHCKPLTAVMSANSSGINLVDSKNVCLSYSILARDSLKAASMDHGLQYNAIYWETGHRTFLPFWASLKQKFSWKIIDDQVRVRKNLSPSEINYKLRRWHFLPHLSCGLDD
eukprot:GHVT01025101.1.p1 GENE.GHVT01025101.1~~GHVT01025101.1.p1  ORF type:complete len:127 (+),score=4.23 GHVT01025101.1:346-726(+)